MTNEQKCPVCGEEEYDPLRSSSGEFAVEGTIECENPVFVCHNKNCPLREFEYDRDKYNKMNTLIQLRIDKEKAAAAQEDRERVDDEYTERIEELEALLRDWKERCQCD